MSDSRRPTLREHLEYRGLLIIGAAVRLLPFPALKHLARFIGAIAFLVDKRGRQVAEANLEAAFGTMDRAKRRRIARQSYQSFARTVLELFWAPNFTPEILRKYVRTEGVEHYAAGEPTIYVCLHASNFELLSLAQAPVIGSGIVVTQNFRNPLLGRIFDRLRASTGHTIIPQERAMIRMLRHLKAGGYFNAVVDFNLDPREASVIIDQFEGLKACVTQIHAALALHTKARIVPAECHAEADGTYRLVHHPPYLSDRMTRPRRSRSGAGMCSSRTCVRIPSTGFGPTSTGGIGRTTRPEAVILLRELREALRQKAAGVSRSRTPHGLIRKSSYNPTRPIEFASGPG